MKGKLKDLTRNLDGTWVMAVTINDDCRPVWEKFKDDEIEIEIKKFRRKRSLDANNFCWALCSDIGKALRPPIPKEEVYRNAIRGFGKYTPMLIKEEAVETFKRIWSNHGVGWFAEKAGDSKDHKGYVWLYAYSGSSTYNTEEMSILIDGLIGDAEQMGIPIPLGNDEVERLKANWRCA